MKLTEKELNEFPIGTKIHCGNNTIIKADFDACNWRNMQKHEWSSAPYIRNTEIDKVEIPTYTEYIPPKPILDDKEKEYLNNLIKPFRNEINYIAKLYKERMPGEYIYIYFNKPIDSFGLPSFPKGKMYKGMEINKKYTLEELGL